MKRKHLIPVIFLIILVLFLGTAHATGDLDNMSLEELQKLQDQLNQKISEKEKEGSQEPPAETAPPKGLQKHSTRRTASGSPARTR